MAVFSFSKLVDSKWIEQQKIKCTGRRSARRILAESLEIKDDLKNKKIRDPGGIWKLRKING